MPVPNDTGILAILTAVLYILDRAIPVVVGLALVVFLFGLLKFLASAGNEDAQTDGRRFMVYGVVTLFVMISVWGLVGAINQLSGIEQGGSGQLPRLAEPPP